MRVFSTQIMHRVIVMQQRVGGTEALLKPTNLAFYGNSCSTIVGWLMEGFVFEGFVCDSPSVTQSVRSCFSFPKD